MARVTTHRREGKYIMLHIIWAYIRMNVLNELAYRANFGIQLVQSLMNLGAALAGLAIIFAHTSALNGWRPEELLALLGIYFIVGGAINMLLQPSMQQLMADIQRGTLDFTLLKPADAQILTGVQRVEIWEAVDIIQGTALLIVALAQMGGLAHVPHHHPQPPLTCAAPLQFALALLAGGAIIYSFWLMLATTAFWLVRVESMLAIFQSMYEAGRWPISLYPSWLRLLLTFVVPVALATTVPAEALLGRLSWPNLAGALLLALLMLIASRLFWRLGLRHYSGASA
jgi:ABC-2 type transport system permease protein